MGDQADVILHEMQAGVSAMRAAIATVVQPATDALLALGRCMDDAADQLRRGYMPLILELDRSIRRHEMLRAQMRRKGKPGWRFRRG